MKRLSFILALLLAVSCTERLDRASFSVSVVEAGLYDQASPVTTWRASAEALLPRDKFSGREGVSEEIRFWYSVGLEMDYVIVCRKYENGWEGEVRTQGQRSEVIPATDWSTFISELQSLDVTHMPRKATLQQQCERERMPEGWSYRIDVITFTDSQSETYFVPEFYVDCHPEYPRILAVVNLFKQNFPLI